MTDFLDASCAVLAALLALVLLAAAAGLRPAYFRGFS